MRTRPDRTRGGHRTPPPYADDALVVGEARAAELLGVSPRTLQKWRVTGEGPAFIKLGKRVGYTRADLDAHVERSRRASTSGAVDAAPASS